MTQQEWEALNATMGYSPEQDASIRKSVGQATANGATVPPGYQTLLPSTSGWMPGKEQYSAFNDPAYGEVDSFGYDAIDSASMDVLSKNASQVKNPNSNVNKVEVKEHNADGTVTTTITENKTNTPSFKGTKESDKKNMKIPMTKPGGLTVFATSLEEVAMYQNNGYVAASTEMAYPEVGSADAKTAAEFDDWRNEYNSRPESVPSQFFDDPMISTDMMGNPIQDQNFAGMNTNDGADQKSRLLNTKAGMGLNDNYYEGTILGNDSLEGNYYGDEVSGEADNSAFSGMEWGGRDTTPQTMYHPSGATVVAEGPEEAALFDRDGYFGSQEELDTANANQQSVFNPSGVFEEYDDAINGYPSDVNRAAELEAARQQAEIDKEYAQDAVFDNELEAASGTQDMMEEDYDMNSQEAQVRQDVAEVNKSPVAKEVVTSFQERLKEGADPQAELKRFVDSSGQLKEWRPKLFQAILGTLAGLIAGESIGAAATAGLGAVGEAIEKEEALAATVAAEDRKLSNEIKLESAKLGLKAPAIELAASKAYDTDMNTFIGKMTSAYVKTDKYGKSSSNGLRGEIHDLEQRLRSSKIRLTASEKRAVSNAIEKSQKDGTTVLGNWYQNTVLIDTSNSTIEYTPAYMDKAHEDEHLDAMGYMSAKLYQKYNDQKAVQAQIAAYYSRFQKEADANNKNSNYAWKGRFPAWMRDEYTKPTAK